MVESVTFSPPFAEQTPFSIELPAKFQDASGRPLAAPESFPLKVATGPMPPLAKFAASPFGVVERLAEPKGVALMPVTLRRVEPALTVQALTPGQVSALNPKTDAEIIAWFRKVRRYDSHTVPRRQVRRDVKGPLPRVLEKNDTDVHAHGLAAGRPAGVKTLDMPSAGGDPRPFEVIGIPLTPGFHVLEIASQKLGASLLDSATAQPHDVRAHHGAGHQPGGALQAGPRERGGLGDDAGQGQGGGRRRGARVRLPRQGGGQRHHRRAGLASLGGIVAHGARRAPTASDDGGSGAYFVSARAKDDARASKTWPSPGATGSAASSPGASTCRPAASAEPDRVAHTIFDRTLLRAGETVSMKHLIRTQTSKGFGLPAERARHAGRHARGQRPAVHAAAEWRKTGTGGQSAENTFAFRRRPSSASTRSSWRRRPPQAPTAARTAQRAAQLHQRQLPRRGVPPAGARRPHRAGPKEAAGAPATVADRRADQLRGRRRRRPACRCACRRWCAARACRFADFDALQLRAAARRDEGRQAAATPRKRRATAATARVVADKLPLTLDKDGAGKLTIDRPAPSDGGRASCCWRPPTPTPTARCRPCAARRRCGRPR